MEEKIWSDCKGIQTHNHLVRKWTLNHLAKVTNLVNGLVFVYELSGCGLESRCSHFNFRYCGCFVQGIPWHSGNYRVWIHSKTRTWHNNNIQLRRSKVFNFQCDLAWSREKSVIWLKVGLSPSKKVCCLLDWKPFKIDEKCFLFQLKSFFVSQDIYIFVTFFWSCRRNGLIRNIRLTSKLITSQPGLQTAAMQILPNISQSKGKQTFKFGKLIEYNKRNIFSSKIMQKMRHGA